MNFNDPNHPIWDIIKHTSIGILGLAYCAIMYKNGVAMQDLGLLVIPIIADYLSNKNKQRLRSSQE